MLFYFKHNLLIPPLPVRNDLKCPVCISSDMACSLSTDLFLYKMKMKAFFTAREQRWKNAQKFEMDAGDISSNTCSGRQCQRKGRIKFKYSAAYKRVYNGDNEYIGQSLSNNSAPTFSKRILSIKQCFVVIGGQAWLELPEEKYHSLLRR